MLWLALLLLVIIVEEHTVATIAQSRRQTSSKCLLLAGSGKLGHTHSQNLAFKNDAVYFQFVYHPNWSKENTLVSAIYLSLTHLEIKDSYVRMLFINFSIAFNTIISQQLPEKLSLLGLKIPLSNLF